MKFDVVKPQLCIFVPHSLHTAVRLLADWVKVMIRGIPGGLVALAIDMSDIEDALHTWRMSDVGVSIWLKAIDLTQTQM